MEDPKFLTVSGKQLSLIRITTSKGFSSVEVCTNFKKVFDESFFSTTEDKAPRPNPKARHAPNNLPIPLQKNADHPKTIAAAVSTGMVDMPRDSHNAITIV